MRQMLTHRDAKPRKRQHTAPCSDCPWARKALHGWLGGMSAQEWIQAAHGESRAECHTVSNQQCAGMAIYRANVHKVVRDPSVLSLPANRVSVFASFTEFLNHHAKPTF
jgi:hypothetical protein